MAAKSETLGSLPSGGNILLLDFCLHYVFEKTDFYKKTNQSTMLVDKRSASVTPKVNVRNPLHAGKKACKKECKLALKPMADIIRSLNLGWPHKKDLCLPKI